MVHVVLRASKSISLERSAKNARPCHERIKFHPIGVAHHGRSHRSTEIHIDARPSPFGVLIRKTNAPIADATAQSLPRQYSRERFATEDRGGEQQQKGADP
jgi:hypothetical protein